MSSSRPYNRAVVGVPHPTLYLLSRYKPMIQPHQPSARIPRRDSSPCNPVRKRLFASDLSWANTCPAGHFVCFPGRRKSLSCRRGRMYIYCQSPPTRVWSFWPPGLDCVGGKSHPVKPGLRWPPDENRRLVGDSWPSSAVCLLPTARQYTECKLDGALLSTCHYLDFRYGGGCQVLGPRDGTIKVVQNGFPLLLTRRSVHPVKSHKR
ncbi:hypothetical protein V8F06_000399 [Rhypophila decipiens]